MLCFFSLHKLNHFNLNEVVFTDIVIDHFWLTQGLSLEESWDRLLQIPVTLNWIKRVWMMDGSIHKKHTLLAHCIWSVLIHGFNKRLLLFQNTVVFTLWVPIDTCLFDTCQITHAELQISCDTITELTVQEDRLFFLFGEASALLSFVHPYVHKGAGQRCIMGCVLIWIQS